jgi:hypothetical protein
MFPKFDKVINDDPQPSGSTSANTCINANVSGWHPYSNEYYMVKLKEVEHHTEQMKLCFDNQKAFTYHLNQAKRNLNACR